MSEPIQPFDQERLNGISVDECCTRFSGHRLKHSGKLPGFLMEQDGGTFRLTMMFLHFIGRVGFSVR